MLIPHMVAYSKAQKDGNISVQFQAGVNSTYMKKMNFTAKFAVSKLNQQ